MLVPNDIYFRVSRKWWFLATRSAAYLRYVSTGSARNYHLQAALALDAGIPVIIHPIFPIAAFALPDPGQARHRLDSRHVFRSEEHTSEHQSLMRNSYAVFCLKKKKSNAQKTTT